MPRASRFWCPECKRFCVPGRQEGNTMYPMIPGTVDGALEMACYFFTVVTAVISYLLTLR